MKKKLIKKIRFSESMCCDECIAEMNYLSERNRLICQIIKDLKNKYVDALSENFKKDYAIQQLKNQLDRLVPPDTMTKTPSNSDPVLNKFFSKDQLEKCESITCVKSHDSKFILMAVRELYTNKLETVKEKSALGRTKNAMSPEKYSALKEFFGNRLKNVDDPIERKSRMDKFNTHINSAFGNITKSLRK